MDEIRALLAERAADADVSVQLAWDIKVNSDITWVKAATVDDYDEPEEAFRAGWALQQALLSLGYERRYRCDVGAILDENAERWRGTVRVGLVGPSSRLA